VNLLSIFLLCLLFIVAGYWIYSAYLICLFEPNTNQPTPAHMHKDDIEFIPTHPFYLFFQHFSAIAASGPIAGPILACQKWGWLPCMLWICLGVVFIGAVHDFAVLTLSVRHRGASIVEIAKQYIGFQSATLLLLFIWLALIYITVAFTQVTAATFVSVSEELQGISNLSSNPGGAVFAAAIFYLLLCLLLGIVTRFLKTPLWLTSIIFIPAMFAVIWMGTLISTWFIVDQKVIEVGILFYCGIASVSPIWLLLQPRGYLGGFVLLFVIFIGLYGIFFGQFPIEQPIFKESDGDLSSLFPFLFVTIACGACSGFQGLVCGGTTSKQIDKETHTRAIGYGAMLAEGIVALIALSTIMIFSPLQIMGLKPGTIYGRGIGEYLSLIVGEEYRVFAITFGAMAFSTFVFDTLDVATRISRYLIEELFGWKKKWQKLVSLFITLGPPFIIIMFAPNNAWISFWTLFGSANQMLAALSLLAVSLWLKKHGKNFWVSFVPMCFILCITLWSMTLIFVRNIYQIPFSVIATANSFSAIALILIAFFILFAPLKQK